MDMHAPALAVRRIGLMAIITASPLFAASNATAAEQQQRRAVPVAPPTAQALPNFEVLVDRYGPAVVNVEAIQRASAQPYAQQIPEELLEFFRRFGMPTPESGPQGYAPPARGAGSGFIISNDGYILTNAHVAGDAQQVTVRLTDRREFDAKVIGADPVTDVALLKIEANNLPVVTLGDPDALDPGEWVLAIGSPFGLENSATAGIVSATSRSVSPQSYVPFIQTDVAVNPGNSGGPLFNMQGEVVGINSMIFSQTGGYMGLSFAIPIDVAIDIRDQLLKTGRVVRGRIGVTVQDVNAQLADSFGLDRPRGALVSSVEEGGPADKAGVQAGDVILAVNDQPIDRNAQLSRRIAEMKPGSEAELRIWRGGRAQALEVTIGEMESRMQQTAQAGQGATSEQAKLGLTVRPLTAAEKQQAGTNGEIVVQNVSGPAASAGVRPGDILLGVNGERIESIEQLRDATGELEANESAALLIERGEAQIFVPVRAGAAAG